MKKHLTLCLAFAVALVLAATPAARADHVFLMFFDGSQETPPNSSGGYGFGVAIMSDDALRVDWAIQYAGLEGTTVSGSHFHIAPFGVAGGVVRGYPTSMFPLPEGLAVGEWTSKDREPLNERAISAFFDGNVYFNIHTAPLFPGGEIRGQAFYLFSF